MTGNVMPIKQAVPVQAGFVETATTRAIHRALRRAHSKAKITMIAGAPGIGKTEAIWQFFDADRYRSFLFTAVSGEGGVFNVACRLCEALGT